MTGGARLFAYTTWALMISLGIIIFTRDFLVFISDPEWIGLVALLGFGFIYLNFSYLVSKRYIRKVFQETRMHYLVALLIYIPPASWVLFIDRDMEGGRFLFLIVIAFACGLGAYYGHKSGRKQQQKHLEEIRLQNGKEQHS